jgi:hypothetical protein
LLVELSPQYLDAEAVAFASRALDDASVAFKWHKVHILILHRISPWIYFYSLTLSILKGDVILIDNLTVMHSRQTFVPPRRTLARQAFCLCFFACKCCAVLVLLFALTPFPLRRVFSICKSMPHASQPQ